MRTFELPDLGEGLAEAEIVRWHVQEGDEVAADRPLVTVETAKAMVDVPAPYAGRVVKRFAEEGAIVATGDPLAGFEGEARSDAGTVVGHLEGAAPEAPAAPEAERGTLPVTPAVRALARKLEVDLAVVTPTGKDGLITATDVRRVARILAEAGPLEPLRGVRRAMARNIARAHAEVVPVTLMDEADLGAWPEGADVTLRLIRGLVAGCRAEPSLNAWYDGHAVGRRVLAAIHLGIAVDRPEGLFVAVLRDAGERSAEAMRSALDELKAGVAARSIPPERMRGYTITLSNFGMIAGRHATPIVVPPTVAILGAGRLRRQVVAGETGPEIHRVLPLSLTFDHRAVTGGEAGRFLRACIEDLERPE